MARKKEALKPLFSVKHDFVESLDHFAQASITFLQAVETALQLGQVKEGPAKDLLQEQVKAFRAALTSDD